MIGELRLIAMMYNDTVVIKDFTRREDDREPIYWFPLRETVQMANLVLCIEKKTGRTEVLKNRWGDKGMVARLGVEPSSSGSKPD